MTSKDALNILTDWFHSYKSDNGTIIHEKHITKDYEAAKKTIEKDLEVLDILKSYARIIKTKNTNNSYIHITITYLADDKYNKVEEWLNGK